MFLVFSLFAVVRGLYKRNDSNAGTDDILNNF